MTVIIRPIIAVDAALPMRDDLLDPCRAPVPVEASSIDVVRCKYRVGESLRVLYRCATPDGERLVTVRAAAGRDPRWWTFPDDRRLPGAAAMMAPQASVVALADGRAWVRSEVAEYAPERSLTVRAVDGVGRATAYAKLFAPGERDVDALAARYDHIARALLRSGRDVAAPRALGWSERQGMLVLDAMTGTRWADLPAVDVSGAVQSMGRAIATLHDVPPRSGTPTFGRLASGRLARAVTVLAAARPDVGAEVAAVLERLEATRPADQPVLLHGDCHPKNAIVDGGRLALIDLDQAGIGPASADIGSLLARLHVGTIVGAHDASTAVELIAAFDSGYSSCRSLPPPATRDWHTSAALIAEQAVRAVNRLRPDVLGHLHEVVHVAGALIPRRSR